MSNVTTRITTDKQVPGYWRVTLNHPPINLGHRCLAASIFSKHGDRKAVVPVPKGRNCLSTGHGRGHARDVSVHAGPLLRGWDSKGAPVGLSVAIQL